MLTVNYRPQRGTFDDSMKERRVYPSVQILLQKENTLGHGLTIGYYCYDDRLRAETFIVSDNQIGALGFMWFSMD